MKFLVQALILGVLFQTYTGWAKNESTSKANCSQTEFKSWDELKKSPVVTVTEDTNTISVTSSCNLKFHQDFKLNTTKDLKITSMSLDIKNRAEVIASRILLKAEDLKTGIQANICADVIILIADKSELKAVPCNKV